MIADSALVQRTLKWWVAKVLAKTRRQELHDELVVLLFDDALAGEPLVCTCNGDWRQQNARHRAECPLLGFDPNVVVIDSYARVRP